MPPRYTAGEGGYGPPWEREVQRVVDDLVEGYVSREASEQQYGLRLGGRSRGILMSSEYDEAPARPFA